MQDIRISNWELNVIDFSNGIDNLLGRRSLSKPYRFPTFFHRFKDVPNIDLPHLS